MAITPYKKKDGKTYYKFREYLGVRYGKEVVVKRGGFATKKDAQTALAACIENFESGIGYTSKTYENVYIEWLGTYKLTVKESTLKTTISLFDNHIIPIIGGRRISEITYPELQEMINRLADKKKIRTIKTYLSNIFEYAQKCKYIKDNPCKHIRLPKQAEKSQEDKFENYFDKDELKAFLSAIKCLSPMWEMFFFLIAFTGIRRGEALALEWNDIDFENHTISINKNLSKGFEKAHISSTKTSSGNRTISIDQTLINKLLDYKKITTNNTIVFPNTKNSHITFSQVARQLDKVYKHHPDLTRITAHGLRHTHCCLLFEAGASIAQVQQRLGHKDVSITLGIYNHVTKGKIKEGAELFAEYMLR